MHEVVRRRYTSPVVTVSLLVKFYPIFGSYALCTMKIGDFRQKAALYGTLTLIEDDL